MQTNELFLQQTEFGKLYQIQLNNMFDLINELNANSKSTNIIYQRLLNEYSNYPLFKTTLLKIGYDCFYTKDNGILQKIDSINRLNPNSSLYVYVLQDIDKNKLFFNGIVKGEYNSHDNNQYKSVQLNIDLLKHLINSYFG